MSLVYVLAAHAIADFPLQTDRMAAEKFDDWWVRYLHSSVHAICTLPAAFLLFGGWFEPIAFAYILGWIHYAIDTRRWAPPKEGFEDYPVWVDQSLHIASIAILHAFFVAV